jgi:hypothetical protein
VLPLDQAAVKVAAVRRGHDYPLLRLKLKALLRKAAERTVDRPWAAIGRLARRRLYWLRQRRACFALERRFVRRRAMTGKPQQFLTAFGLAGGLALTCTPAHATFILDTSCQVSQCAEGTDFFIDNVNKNVMTFTGTAAVKLTGPAATVETSANVDTGRGFATITPTTTLTALIFTPADDTLFSGFSFRGQLAASGFTGTIDVSWTDSNGKTGSITFTGVKGPDADFDRLGIASHDGETLKLVTVSVPPSEAGGESFKEFKHIEFSFAIPAIPEPSTWAMMLLGFAGLGFLGYRQTRRAKPQAA